MPTTRVRKGSRRKKPSSLAAHHGEFHVSTPYWHPQCTQAVGPGGPRVPKAGPRVVFRTETLSDIPPFRGAFTGFPTPFQGRGGRSPAPPGRRSQAVGTVHVSRTRLLLLPAEGRDKSLKRCHARVRYVSVPPCDLIGRPPSPRALPPADCAATDVNYHNPAPLPRLEPNPYYRWPYPGNESWVFFAPAPVSKCHATHAGRRARAHGHLVTDSSRKKSTKKEWSPAGVARNGRTGSGLSGRTPGAMSPF